MRKRLMAPTLAAICAAICAGLPAWAQTTLTWEEVKARFETANPTLRAGQLNISESKAQETTAYLNPNPSMTVSVDQFEPFSGNPYRPFGSLLPFVSMDYLHERQHKRELRLESAQKATGIAETQQLDLERTMLFTLRSAFVQTLQAKAIALAGAGEPGLLQQGTGHLPQPPASRRHRPRGPGPNALAAGAIRERLPGRADQRAHRQD